MSLAGVRSQISDAPYGERSVTWIYDSQNSFIGRDWRELGNNH